MDSDSSSLGTGDQEWVGELSWDPALAGDLQRSEEGYYTAMETPDVTRNQVVALVLALVGQAGSLTSDSDLVKVAALACLTVVLCALVVSDALIRRGRAQYLSEGE